MKVSLAGLFVNIIRDMRSGDRFDIGHYEVLLNELKQHLEELIQGKHTLREFAEHYCLTPPDESK